MKKIITVLTIATTLSLASASIDTNLRIGMKGQEVTELQDFLAEKGFLTTQSSGFFGSLTLKAVKAYQSSVGLTTSGFVGTMTRAKINEELFKPIATTTQPVKVETATTSVQQIIYYVPIAPIAPVVPVVQEDKYTLELQNPKENLSYKTYCDCFAPVSFTVTPVATLNEKPIEVVSCKIIDLNLTEIYNKGVGVIFNANASNYVERIGNAEKGLISCTLVNGKVLSN